jgi:GYF domain 2
MSGLWHYVQNGQSMGPVSQDELRAKLASGGLDRSTQVWSEGMAGWVAASDVADLLPAPQIPLAPIPAAPVPIAAPVAAPIQLAAPVSNPYATPQAAVVRPTMASSATESVPEGALEMLRLTKPWVRFLAVLGFIMMGLTILGGIGFAIFSLVGMGTGNSQMALPMVGMGLAYVVMAAFQLPPVIFLNRYASRIGRLLESGSADDLQEALKAQKSFWKYVGILTLVLMGIYALILLGVVAFAAMGIAKR